MSPANEACGLRGMPTEKKAPIPGKIFPIRWRSKSRGHYLKDALGAGVDSGREIHPLSVDETLRHLDAVMQEFDIIRA